ncbi:unnamed protein product [Adineta ricciae]|uniref:G-protein coupled receptors family 1 profile domain-containing protein n=1 Tax=Adineta ricciae TaxID=249248 RepID=A0A814KGL9_ADIRI|nr:unnamed protein product [Adineta ricciae]CAF1315094.1 unnamed protein product [Adineta ricciae]
MASTANSSWTTISQQIIIYLGIPMFIAGLIGNALNLIVFLSLRTFRENSCAFYLIVMSIVSIGQLLASFLSRIMISGFGIDWTLQSVFYCKFRIYLGSACTLITFTCICLATVDQYFATCSNPLWRSFNNIKVAHRTSVSFIVIWMLYSVPYLIYYDHVQSSATGKFSCISTNVVFQDYNIKGYTLVFIGFLPIFIDVLFALLAYHNVRNLSYRMVPLVRRELDKQMTTIVLMQAICIVFVSIPYLIVNILSLDNNIRQNPSASEILQFATTLALCIYYLNFSSQFYVYTCVSSRFRQQLIHVTSTIYRNHWQRNMVLVNQVAPQPLST